MKTKIQNLYLMYINDFLSVRGFADHIGVNEDRANRIIDLGRRINHFEWTQKQLK